ncbi:hypothetical protein BN1095_7250001 [Clostridioides difficile]|uniref:Uncharacterized protein n=1 Tax=Clostridioides difficile TaxID=1496 RepID=A0A069AVE3_CLODI|nr:hypothetical protein BN1095_7250001 [Clostridioides difficile]
MPGLIIMLLIIVDVFVKLTPRECLRLMGFRDDFKILVSDTQMYRQAGNSIVVDVLIRYIKTNGYYALWRVKMPDFSKNYY